MTDSLTLFPVLQPPFPSAPSVSAWARAGMLLKEKVYLSGIHSPACPKEELHECWCWHHCRQHGSVVVAAYTYVATGKLFVKPGHHTWQQSSFIAFFFSWFSALISSFFAWIGVLACWRGWWGVEAEVGSERHGKQQLLKVPLQPQTYIAKKIFPNLVWSAIQFPNA